MTKTKLTGPSINRHRSKKLPLTPEQATWLPKVNPNPMVNRWGKDPEGNHCRYCVHLVKHKPGANVYFKCRLRGITNGPGTDHRMKWDACAKFKVEP